MNFPKDLKFSKEHEWVRLEGDIAIVGISDFAQSELGEIVFVDIETLGENIPQEGTFGSIEAVKTVSDLYMPISGEILEVNADLDDNPDLVNSEPYGKGWLIKIHPNNLEEMGALMSADEYKEFVGK